MEQVGWASDRDAYETDGGRSGTHVVLGHVPRRTALRGVLPGPGRASSRATVIRVVGDVWAAARAGGRARERGRTARARIERQIVADYQVATLEVDARGVVRYRRGTPAL